jgi:putative membrane protein
VITRRRFHQVDLGRFVWKRILLVVAIETAVVVVYRNFLHGYIASSIAVVTVLGTAISFFIGFINAQAYGRWWEARKIWGAVVNDSRSWARMVLTFIQPNGHDAARVDALKRRLVLRHIAFLYATKEKLRGDDDDYSEYLSDDDREDLEGQGHVPNALLTLQGRDLDRAERDKVIDVIRLNAFNNVLSLFSDELGKSERIKNTVFPPIYPTLVRSAVYIFMLVFPAALSDQVGYWAILYGSLLSLIFVLTSQSGQSLMNPFERQPMDVNIGGITRTIEINLLEQLHSEKIPEPLQAVNDLYVL